MLGGPRGVVLGQGGVPALTAVRSPRSKAEAEAIEKELLEDYRFGRQQLIEIWGHACAMAVTKAFPLPSLPRKQPTVLVVCGPAQNGAIGLVCARHLRIFDYEPTIFYPKRSPDPLYRDFTTQCEKMDIPFLSYLPTEVQLINDAYNAVVDAVLGAEAEATEGREPCAAILATLKLIRIPIVSLDVPSGLAPCSASPQAGWNPPSSVLTPRLSPSPLWHHPGLSAWVVGEPLRSPPRVGTAPGTPSFPPPQPGSIPAGSPGWQPLSTDAFRASTINNKLLELRHDVI
ncbi:yjeF N-terminal domain-containing protein 3 isoform X1 [Falco peregrinus]|uniref:yjeF N-terminal domain-containing protein 3 isoform X1 n=1 Tax=Falco peregrinus TaxID=8954 RepID=UPI002478D7B0|nr:yjeF N-terminal domain-containing protein 3 isoform X1 [Falco peregrinus]